MPAEQLKSSMGTTAALGCLKILLMIFNIVFWVTGIALLVLGIWMKIQLYVYFQITTAHYSPTVAYALIGIGAAIVVIGMLGCMCTVKGTSPLLYMYAVFLVLVFIAELSAGISGFVYRGKLEEDMKSGLVKAVNEEYGTKAEITKAVDTIQTTLQCCGVVDYADWFDSSWEQEQTGKTNIVPESCCKQNAPSCDRENLPPSGSNKTLTINEQGCNTKVVDFIDKNFGIIGGTVIGIAFLMLIGAMLSWCLAKQVNRSKYEQVA